MSLKLLSEFKSSEKSWMNGKRQTNKDIVLKTW